MTFPSTEEAASHPQRYRIILEGLFRIDPHEHWTTAKTVLKWTILSSLVGVFAGTASAIFLTTLAWATATRFDNPNLLLLLPIVGVILGWVYHRFAGTAARGNNLVIEEVNTNKAPIPARMAPFVLFGTILTHLFGGSAGREGTAIQMGSSLADWLQRTLKLSPEDRRMMIMAGISGGFGSVFGTPIAGFVFGLEVQSVGRIRYDGILPCLIAAIVGDLVTHAWGVTHSHYPRLAAFDPDAGLLLKVAIAGVVFGLASLLFIELTHGIKHLMKHLVDWPPLRPALGGLLIIGLVLVTGTHDYLGLSLPLIQNTMNGTGVETFAFLLKIIFTAVTLGSGFLGGEVTPLFVIGSTLGFTLGRALGTDPGFMAALGFVAVFSGASNTPLACALMGIELFGGGSALYLILGTFVAYLASGHRSIYVTQRVGVPKARGLDIQDDETLEKLAERRPGWLRGR
jgi:H+/Cl- antiporter ClcA